jgi:hypothetical protein
MIVKVEKQTETENRINKGMTYSKVKSYRSITTGDRIHNFWKNNNCFSSVVILDRAQLQTQKLLKQGYVVPR